MRMKALILLALIISLFNNAPANATKTFKNCSELNKVYKGGVALPGAYNQGGATKYKPKFSAALYAANKKSDRDRDGIACEK
jgi:hypothetical protein